MSISWNRAYRQFLLDIKLWLFCLLLFQCHRLIFIFRLSDYIAKHASTGDIVLTCLNGFRFDSANAGYAILIPFLLITLPSCFFNLSSFANRFRAIWGGIIVLLIASISTISVEYYKEYHNVFDDFLFGLIYDDRVSIMKTIWTTYGISLLFYVGMMIALFFLYRKVGPRWLGQPWFEPSERPRTLPTKIFISLWALLFLVGASRGSVGHRPVELKDAGVTRDPFLNKAELNPYTALRYAIDTHWEMGEANGLNKYIDGDLKKAAQFYFQKEATNNNLDDDAQKIAKGPTISKPAHIFLIVMESYGTWPLMEKYAPLGVSNGLKHLAAEGIFIPAFLPASSSTQGSLGAIITVCLMRGLQRIIVKRLGQSILVQWPTHSKNWDIRRRCFMAAICHGSGLPTFLRIKDLMKYMAPQIWGIG